MKKYALFLFLSSVITITYAQSKVEITQTNPLSNILSYNVEYINQAQKLLNHHQQFISKVANGNPYTNYLKLEDVRGVKVSIVSNLDMPVLQAGLIRFDNQQLKYVVNSEQANQLISQSCRNTKNFLSLEPLKLNSTLEANVDYILNISLKDGYKVHFKYMC